MPWHLDTLFGDADRMIRIDMLPRHVTETLENVVRNELLAAASRKTTHDSKQRMADMFNKMDGAVFDRLSEELEVRAPADFAAMLAAYPGLQVIEFLDAPGTSHDIANLKVGRAIRNAGLATHVPAGGSARSGAVELFLAGTRRTVDPGALFAVHSWRDEKGREPADFAPDAPENRLYLDYYAEMGMTADQASAFYAMTNSVPHASARWLQGEEMTAWIAPDARTPASRTLDPQFESGLRLALARSGGAIAGLLHAVRVPAPTFALTPRLAPRLAYADQPAGLLDSWSAFP